MYNCIYISGKMSGLSVNNYENLFFNAENHLKKLFPNAKIINPVVLGWQLETKLGRVPTYQEFLFEDIKQIILNNCDCVYMLNNYENSNGALAELYFAKAIGCNIIYQKEENML